MKLDFWVQSSSKQAASFRWSIFQSDEDDDAKHTDRAEQIPESVFTTKFTADKMGFFFVVFSCLASSPPYVNLIRFVSDSRPQLVEPRWYCG